MKRFINDLIGYGVSNAEHIVFGGFVITNFLAVLIHWFTF